MTQHTHKVIHQSKLIKLAKWRKGIKYMLGECKTPGGVLTHRTVYKDDSEKIEYFRSKKKNKTIPSPHSNDYLINQMERESYEEHRKLFEGREK